MKRKMGLMMGMFMALLLFSIPVSAESATAQGDWELVSVVLDGVTYEDMVELGQSMTMNLEADGTAVQTINEEVYYCTWTEADGVAMIDAGNGPVPYILQPDGTLLREDEEGDSLTFVRVSDAEVSAAGTWKLTSAESEGIIVNDTSTLDVEVSFLFNEDGTGMIISNQGEGPCTWTQSGTTVTVMEENSETLSLTLQDGKLIWLIDDVTLYLTRTDTAAEAPESSENAVIESEYGFSLRLPENWVAIDSEYIAQIVESAGEEITSANGFDQSLLDQLDAAKTSMYYNPNTTANFAVVREPAGDVTMDNFASLEVSFQESYSSGQGITDFKLSGPVDINGRPYYIGTFTAQTGMEQMQYFCVANGYIYTVTMTNVSEGDAEQIMESFEIL